MTRALKRRLRKLVEFSSTKRAVAVASSHELDLYDELVRLGFATSEPVGSDYGYLYTRFRITDSGRRAAREL